MDKIEERFDIQKTHPEQPEEARRVTYDITTKFGLDDLFDAELEKLIEKHLR
jgi:uncharacterized protein YpuA (DUF1002 family)